MKISLIDYTLSRVEMEELDESGANRTAYLDLDKDPALFAGVGEYQYDIYRLSVWQKNEHSLDLADVWCAA